LWKAIAPAALINHQALSPAEEAAAEKAGMLVVTPVFRPRGGRTFRSFQRRIGELQVHHLADVGHRRLGFALPDDDRLRAFTAPGDLAVIGVDAIPAARLSAPPLTTVATGMAVFGEHLADLVSSSLNGKPRPPRPADDVLAVIRRQTT